MSQRIPSVVLPLAICLISALPVIVVAQNADRSVMGQWKAVAQTQEGAKTSHWTFQESGAKLTGKIASEDWDEDHEAKNLKAVGKEFSFQFSINTQGTDVTIQVKMELASDRKMEGNYTVEDQAGNELAAGELTAVKQAQPINGKWNTVATLPDGNEMESSLTLKGKPGEMSGVVTTQNGDRELKKITVKDGTVRLELEVEREGNTIEIVIEADQKSDQSLVGKWILIQDGLEVDSGDWKATRVKQPMNIATTGSTTLFDGTSLENFRGYAAEKIGDGWKVVDGTLHLDGTKRTGDIVTKSQYANFVLEFEWKISAGGNSGVMYRVSLDEKKPWHTGAEYQLLDDAVHKDGKNELTSSGAIYALYPPTNKALKPVGQWNTTKIVLNGNKLEHWLNGAKVAEAEIGSRAWNEKVAASKFSKQKKFGKNAKGHICFQDHGNPVWFRKIKIRSLD